MRFGRGRRRRSRWPRRLLTVVIATTASNAGSGPRCGGKPATIVRGGGDNNIYGTDSADVIVAGGGDDYIDGGEGRDRVCGNGGDDIAYGGERGDFVNGGRGKDLVEGSTVGLNRGPDGGDKLLGGRGSDSGQ